MRLIDLRIVLDLFFRSSRLHQKRAMLTVAAITWGTVAILLLLSFGEGLERQMDKNRRSTGENIAIMWPSETTKAWQGMPPGRQLQVRTDAVDYLRERLPEIKTVIGEIHQSRTALAYGRKTANGRVIGTNWEYGETRKHYPLPGGRFFSARDEADKRRVVFLGDELAKEIFADEEPLGKTLLINNSPFTVIGVMKKKTQMGVYGGPDANHAVIPLTTFRAQFGRDMVTNLLIEVEKPELMKPTLKKVNQVLGAKYGYDPTDERAFWTWDTIETSKMFGKVMMGIQLFMMIIGSLTLLIGGVGVANIMYAVVKERTREIGVKMALGARRSWIIGPFLLEGLTYTLTGGLLGISIATLLVSAATFLPVENNEVLSFLGRPTLSWQIGVLTSAILGLVGIFAGYFPARRAATIDPATTLRYE